MAFFTNRNNIKPELRGIALMVVIIYRLFVTGTFQAIRSREFPGSNGIFYSFTGLTFFWMSFFIVTVATFPGNFAFYCLAIALLYYFAFFRCVISQPSFAMNFFTLFGLLIIGNALYITSLTTITITIWAIWSFVKFGKRFNLFAFGTLFCYDLLRHDFLLTRKLCLEPFARPILVFGSSYYNNHQYSIKYNFQNFRR